MLNNFYSRRKFLTSLSVATLTTLAPNSILAKRTEFTYYRKLDSSKKSMDWQVGIGSRIITPRTSVWLAGYDGQRVAYGKLHDLFVKVLALKDSEGNVIVMATTDNQGMSKTISERLFKKIHARFGLSRSDFMLTFSHNHQGPRLEDDLVDYYPVDDKQTQIVKEHSLWMEDQIMEAVEEALANWQPARLYKGEGSCTFAVNRRENPEIEVPRILAEGKPLKGAVDHDVPVLAIKSPNGNLIAAIFGYACHPTTLQFNTWSGDYPGFAQINLEENYPGAAAMFFNACGGDQNPLPRRELELCKKYGKMLSDAVVEVLNGKMEPISSGLSTAFKFVNLDYEKVATRDTLLDVAKGSKPLQARWARRMFKKLEENEVFPTYYSYPVQVWKLGTELLFIGIGGEAVVDYSIRFKREYNQQTTWVCGYANEMAAYIPSRRVWEEGGYEGGSHLDEYGLPAWRWAGDVEDRIAETVSQLVLQLQKES